MKRGLLFIILIAVLNLTGCVYWKVTSFQPHKNAQTKNHKFHVALISTPKDLQGKIWSNKKVYEEILENEEYKGFKQAVYDACEIPIDAKLTGSVLPIVGVAAKLIFDLHMEEVKNDAKSLSDSAIKKYSGTQFLTLGSLKKSKCIIIARFSNFESDKPETDPNIGLLAVLKIKEIESQAFVLSPYYVELKNSVANTSQRKPIINLSMGFSIKAIGLQDNKLPGLFSVGEGVVSVNNLSFEKDGKQKYEAADLKDIKSDLIPFPQPQAPNDPLLSVSLSVVETGVVGFELEQAEAELTAIKEAIGPGVKEAVINKLKDDE